MERKHVSMSGKGSDPGSVNKALKRKVKLDEDKEKENEDVAPVKESMNLYKILQEKKSNQNGKDLKPSIPRSKGQESETNKRKQKQKQRTQFRRRY